MEKQNGQAAGGRKLSLQQKMVEIRKMIPALTKKTYSEEVSYDFVKIDDIFLYLTPALNKYGVNLDILSEKATKTDERGNPVYVQYLAQSQIWMYEVDLTLRWVNADDPQDMDERTIHAIGTHEMPDKAKGSAWTYALKYYLLNRFCIDQGASGEDPDLYSHPVINDIEHQAGESEDEVYANENYDRQMEPKEEGQTADLGEFQAVEDEEIPFSDAEPAAAAHNTATPQKRAEITDSLSSAKGASMPSGTAGSYGETQTKLSQKEGKTANHANAEKSVTQSESIPPASPQVRPENGRMVQLPETAAAFKGPQGGMTVEEASQVICRCGTYRNWPLGRIAQEQDGIKNLMWLAYDYRGKDETMRQGARILLQTAKIA